jgi:hypothetical protein
VIQRRNEPNGFALEDVTVSASSAVITRFGESHVCPEFSRYNRAVRIFAALYLLIQTGLPICKLREPRPNRFAWAMYSSLGRIPRVDLMHRDGTKENNIGARFALIRPETDYSTLPAHICAVTPEATALLVTWPKRDPERLECRK